MTTPKGSSLAIERVFSRTLVVLVLYIHALALLVVRYSGHPPLAQSRFRLHLLPGLSQSTNVSSVSYLVVNPDKGELSCVP